MNHNKYMVTERSGYIGTSNWEADYFINTGGIGFAFTPMNSTNKGGLIILKKICYSSEGIKSLSTFFR